MIITVHHARRDSGLSKGYAIMGGFHLSGPAFSSTIEDTLGELEKISPSVLVPMHCEGWDVIRSCAKKLLRAFALNSVGTRFAL